MRPLRLLSSLASVLHAFAEYRHALGYGDRSLQAHLVHFDRFLVQRGWSDCILTRDLVQDWAAFGGPLTARTRALRLHAMRMFARFHAQTHLDSYISGLAWGPRCQSSFRAHVYTPAELRALLGEAARLSPPDSLRPRTYVTLLGLLACTGLRISGAICAANSDALISFPWNCNLRLNFRSPT